jgi:hypothetical protein
MNLVSKTLSINLDGNINEIEVFNTGEIRKNNRVLKPVDNGAGYLAVVVGYKRTKSGRLGGVLKYIHRLVATAFIPNEENLPQVNHKDFDKSNNSVENLEWISRADNIQHSHDNGRMKNRYTVGAVKVLSVDEVIECYTRVMNGEGVNVVAESMGKPRTTISSIINKRSRRDITDKLDKQTKGNHETPKDTSQ